MLRAPEETPRQYRRRALFIAAVALVVVYLLWNVPQLEFLVYPFRLFVTYVHEAGHSLMALLTGGRVLGFNVSTNGSGLAITAGGARALIIPAGYLGAAFFGAVLFYLVNRVRRTQVISMVLGAALIVFSVQFARPDQSGLPLSLIVGFLFGAGLLALGWRANRDINLLLLTVLALITSQNAVLDLFYLINAPTSSGPVRNDAAAFSQEFAPLIPPVVWAVVWAGLALLMLGAAVYLSIIRPIRRGEL